MDQDFPYQDFENMGFSCDVAGQKGYNGVAICSKFPQRRVLKDAIEKHWDEQKRVIAVKVKGIDLINVYAPHGDMRGTDKFQYKLDWYKKLCAFLQQHYSARDYLMVMGDFNVALQDRDVWSPEILADSIGTMPEERQAFRELMEWGLVDAFRHLYPDKRQFTWWDYIGGAIWKDLGMRIDYALCTRPLIEKLENVEVDLWPRRRRKPTPSDHAPLTAAFAPFSEEKGRKTNRRFIPQR